MNHQETVRLGSHLSKGCKVHCKKESMACTRSFKTTRDVSTCRVLHVGFFLKIDKSLESLN